MAALTIEWQEVSATPPYKALVTIPQDYDNLTLLSGAAPNGTWGLDSMAFWQDLKDLEASEDGIVFNDLQTHNLPYTIAGVTYADAISMLCEITFYNSVANEDWTVIISGSNNDIWSIPDSVYNPTKGSGHLSLVSQNSAGLVEVGTSGLTTDEAADLAVARKMLTNRRELADGTTGNMVVYDDNDVTVLFTFDVSDEDDNAITLGAGDPAKQSKGV